MEQFEKLDRARRIVLPLLLLSVLIAAGLWNCREPKPPEKKPVWRNPTAHVEKGTIRVVIEANGSIKPAASVKVKSRVAGAVEKVHAELAEEVRKGELLIALDSHDASREMRLMQARVNFEKARLAQTEEKVRYEEKKAETQLAEAEARVNSLESQFSAAQQAMQEKQAQFDQKQIEQAELDVAAKTLADAGKELERSRNLLRERKESNYDLELARKERDLAAARLEEQNLLLEAAEARLSDTQIVAPIDGVITEKHIEAGQVVASGMSAVEGPPLLEISDLSRLYVDALVDEMQVGYLSENLSAKITLTAWPDREFLGRIVRISPDAVKTDENGVHFAVRIEIDVETKSELRPGMTASVKIVAIEKSGVLRLPEDALVKNAPQPAVQKLSGLNQRINAPVKLGIFDGEYYEVLEGLEEGDEVVLQTPVQVREESPQQAN
ncbi:efflux RND transporter periplasmic adaptor subunit [Candidatus Sumerlaeota bacterium]|nr:efflux RND transporter periplasmic adaptor subunit [Candidatus Sumerlaeota bacterium]